MKTSPMELFAVAAPGLEGACAAELDDLGIAPVEVAPGGVHFSGGLRELYLANLRLRVATRVLVRLGSFTCRDFPTLYRKGLQLPWGRFLRPGTPWTVRATSRRSRLIHSGRVEATLGEALARALGPVEAAQEVPVQQVLARLEEDQVTISVDSSGELLHRRGYRAEQGPAPLRETLAAGLLMLMNWDRRTPLLDPLCGSGTLPIEGLMMALARVPGGGRTYAFMNWPRYRPGLWQALLQEAEREARAAPAPPPVEGWDRDPEVVDLASRNADRAGVAPWLRLHCRPLEDGPAQPGPGLAVCNPPYGLRLAEPDLDRWYGEFGEACRRNLPGWRLGFLCPSAELAARTGLGVEAVARLRNGGVPVTLYAAEL